jgi:hypothetical protein
MLKLNGLRNLRNPLPQPRLFSRGLEIHGLAVSDASGGG